LKDDKYTHIMVDKIWQAAPIVVGCYFGLHFAVPRPSGGPFCNIYPEFNKKDDYYTHVFLTEALAAD